MVGFQIKILMHVSCTIVFLIDFDRTGKRADYKSHLRILIWDLYFIMLWSHEYCVWLGIICLLIFNVQLIGYLIALSWHFFTNLIAIHIYLNQKERWNNDCFTLIYKVVNESNISFFMMLYYVRKIYRARERGKIVSRIGIFCFHVPKIHFKLYKLIIVCF